MRLPQQPQFAFGTDRRGPGMIESEEVDIERDIRSKTISRSSASSRRSDRATGVRGLKNGAQERAPDRGSCAAAAASQIETA